METKGQITKSVNGIDRLFSYGMYTNLLLSRNADLTKISQNMTEFLILLFWAGLVAGSKKQDNDLPEGFEKKEQGLEQMAMWMDTMDINDCAEIYQIAERSLGFTMQILEARADQMKLEENLVP